MLSSKLRQSRFERPVRTPFRLPADVRSVARKCTFCAFVKQFFLLGRGQCLKKQQRMTYPAEQTEAALTSSRYTRKMRKCGLKVVGHAITDVLIKLMVRTSLLWASASSVRDTRRSPSALACRRALSCLLQPWLACGNLRSAHSGGLPGAGKQSVCRDRTMRVSIVRCCDTPRSA